MSVRNIFKRYSTIFGQQLLRNKIFNKFTINTSKFTEKPFVSAFIFGTTAASVYSIDGNSAKYVETIKSKEKEIREAIAASLDGDDYDGHGSYGPVYIRLAWHASGTYDVHKNAYGSNGATMRFDPESKHGANAGLHVARERLEKIKQQFPEISYADLWTLAGAVAVEEMGGPKINWRPGRSDFKKEKQIVRPDGNLPDASQGASHVRDVFYRMGFNDREITALIGAHAVGKCHSDRSGYEGPWTRAPSTFSNQFFVLLLNEKWTFKNWKGPQQYENKAKDLMMLPADYAFLTDPIFNKYVKEYANDEEKFFKDFAAAFSKLLELGVEFPK